MRDLFDEISIGDLTILSDLPNFNSLRAFARSRNAKLSNVSRLLKRLEDKFGAPLIGRSASGIRLTPFGTGVCQNATEVLLHFRKFADFGKNRPKRKTTKLFTLASEGFLNMCFGPFLVKATQSEDKNYGMRFLDITRDEMILAAKSGALDLVLDIGEIDLGKNWTTHLVGDLYWDFFCAQSHPLLSKESITADQLSDYAVITETYWDGTKVSTRENVFPPGFPLQMGKYESETAVTAIAIASVSDCIAYIPQITVPQMRKNRVVPLNIRNVNRVSHPLYLSVEVDKLTKHFSDKLFRTLTSALSSLSE